MDDLLLDYFCGFRMFEGMTRNYNYELENILFKAKNDQNIFGKSIF